MSRMWALKVTPSTIAAATIRSRPACAGPARCCGPRAPAWSDAGRPQTRPFPPDQARGSVAAVMADIASPRNLNPPGGTAPTPASSAEPGTSPTESNGQATPASTTTAAHDQARQSPAAACHERVIWRSWGFSWRAGTGSARLPVTAGGRRDGLRFEDVDVTRGPVDRAAALQLVVEAAAPVHIVIGQAGLGDPRRR